MTARPPEDSFSVYLRAMVVHTPEEWGQALALATDDLDARAHKLRQLGEERMFDQAGQIGRAAADLLPAGARLRAVSWVPGFGPDAPPHWQLRVESAGAVRELPLTAALAGRMAAADPGVRELLARRFGPAPGSHKNGRRHGK